MIHKSAEVVNATGVIPLAAQNSSYKDHTFCCKYANVNIKNVCTSLVIPYDRKFSHKENLTNLQFSSIDELNVDKCLDSSKSYTGSVKV